MNRCRLAAFAAWCLLFVAQPAARAADKADSPLEGVWQAQTLEAGGKPAPAEAAKRMRFTFQGDKLLLRGNFADDREEECPFTIDAKKSPKQLDFTPPQKNGTVEGIYELNGDELKLCLQHAGSKDGRPTRFATQPGTRVVLILLKKQQP